MNNLRFSLLVLFYLTLASPSQGSINVLISDSFDRTNNTNLNADDTGKSGSLAHVSWSEISHKGSPEIVSNQLQLGE